MMARISRLSWRHHRTPSGRQASTRSHARDAHLVVLTVDVAELDPWVRGDLAGLPVTAQVRNKYREAVRPHRRNRPQARLVSVDRGKLWELVGADDRKGGVAKLARIEGPGFGARQDRILQPLYTLNNGPTPELRLTKLSRPGTICRRIRTPAQVLSVDQSLAPGPRRSCFSATRTLLPSLFLHPPRCPSLTSALSTGFRSFGFPHACYPGHEELAFPSLGLIPTEHSSPCWTHRLFDRTRCRRNLGVPRERPDLRFSRQEETCFRNEEKANIYPRPEQVRRRVPCHWQPKQWPS